MTRSVVADLTNALGRGSVTTDVDIVEAYRRDRAPSAEAGMPVAVVWPRSSDEVAATVRVALEHHVPVVPRGAGSGLAGAANAVEGGIVVCLSRMDRLVEINAEDLYAVVEPGVVTADLAAAARGRGLHYPPDPASADFSTIGGNIATNAGGLCCVKYGVTQDFVLGLDVVLADGTMCSTGRRTVKGVAGYDLTSLFVGSEGTLGIVTKAVVRLRSAPASPATMVASFPTLVGAGAMVAAATAAGIVPSLFELMDRTTVAAVDDWKRMGLDRGADALVIAQSDAPAEQADCEMATLAGLSEQAGADFVVRSSDPAEADALVAARRLAYPALERRGATLLDDVAVPRSRIADLVAGIQRIADNRAVLIGTFGHIGDGNMHPTIVYDRTDADEGRRTMQAFTDIVGLALELGGTITGEHGVGLLKRDLLTAELDPGAMAVHRAVKHALDPLDILNPGKVLTTPPSRR